MTARSNVGLHELACPICGHPTSTDFFSANGVPITCASTFSTREEALAVPLGELTLALCDSCAFVFNRLFDPALGEVGARYESSQAASAHFGEFARGLSRDWVDRYDLRRKTVLEVGSGTGDFLLQLLQDGVGSAIGIDPLADATKAPVDRRLRVVNDIFDERYLDLAADALVCRHTLEHIQDVGHFLALLRKWAERDPRRVLLFELPAAERIFSERAFWDVYYEHCNYFTSDTLEYAFERAGFDVLGMRRVYSDQYLVIEARAAKRIRKKSAMKVDAARQTYHAYGIDVRTSIAQCQTALTALHRESPPLMLWQGASKTVGFASMLPDPSIVFGAIDLSPQRHGKFLPGSGMSVHAPAELGHLRPGSIVLMNPVYLAEVTDQLRGMGLTTPVHTVDQLMETGQKLQRP